jgi:HlyD family secretion protein
MSAVEAGNNKDLSVLQIDRTRPAAGRAPRPGRRRVWVSVVAGIALLIIAAIAYAAVYGNVAQVQVERVGLRQGTAAGETVLTAGGYIVAHHTIEVSSKVVGKVAWIGVEKGDKVKQGQVLVRLEDDEYQAQLAQAKANLAQAEANLLKLEHGSRPEEVAAARAAVEQAQADFENNQLIYNRTVYLARQGVDSPAQLDNAQAQYDMAKAKLDSAKKNYELTKIGPRHEDIQIARAQVEQMKAAVDYAQTMVDSTRIRAPVSGTILDRLVEKGEMVTTQVFGGTGGAKASVVSLADLNDLQVELDINENDFPKISMNQACKVTADSYPDRPYQGVVAQISPQADRQKATIQVKVKVLSPDDYLRPEMNAHVSFLAPATGKAADVLTIPSRAVLQRDGKNQVFVFSGNRVELREVQLGPAQGDAVVVEGGLDANDKVVVSDTSKLASGQRAKAA